MSLSEKISWFKAPGGVTSTCFWLAKIVTGIESHAFYSRDLLAPKSEFTAVKGDYTFVQLGKITDINQINDEQISIINEQSGQSIQHRLNKGGMVFLLTEGNKIACQLCISQKSVDVESPMKLRFEFSDNTCFLSYLYTHEEYRKKGLANVLLNKTCESLRKSGYSRCVTHIRKTNIPSLLSFKKAGWYHIASLYTIPRRSIFISAPNTKEYNIRITTI